MTANYEYNAFGSCLATGGEAETPFRYNGQYTDDETGLIYHRNRYYDPSIGRFTQEDTYWNVNNMIYGDSNSNIPSYSAGQEGNGTDVANAFKHIYWSAAATSIMGTKYTRLFTNAHEFGWYEESLNDPEAMKLDLHNNQRGRILGQLYPYNRLV